MRALIQRVLSASVSIDGKRVGSIDKGLLVLLAVAPNDTERDADWLSGKLARLRVFNDQEGRMNLSVLDVGGSALVVSQFTLYGNCRKGNRPSFVASAAPDLARRLYEKFIEKFRKQGLSRIETGRFGAMMQVSLVNDGPVTIMVDTPDSH